jgi:hypothetical protein
MPDHITADQLDAELRRIAEALVAEAPDVPRLVDDGDIGSVVAQPGASPRHRPLVTVVAAAAALALVAAVWAVTRDNEPAGREPAVLAANAGLEPAPQRLIVWSGRDGWREVPRAGDPIPLGLAGLEPKGAPRPLPGGGHVVVGSHSIPAPLAPEGLNEFTDLTYSLAVVGADGTVDIERDIERSALVGVTDTEAILARQPNNERGEASGPASIVAHDLHSGEERAIRRNVAFGADRDRRTSAASAIVAGDLVTVEASLPEESAGEIEGARDVNGELGVPSRIDPGSEECTLRVTDLATGKEAERPLAVGCQMVLGLRASPDGSRAAVAYERGGHPLIGAELRLAVVDLPSGAVSHDELLGHSIDCLAFGDCPPNPRFVAYQGVAWDDMSTLRVATVDPAGASSELILATMPVG